MVNCEVKCANLLVVLEVVEAQFQLWIALPKLRIPIPDCKQTLLLQLAWKTPERQSLSSQEGLKPMTTSYVSKLEFFWLNYQQYFVLNFGKEDKTELVNQ